jgi:hypothetical protein
MTLLNRCMRCSRPSYAFLMSSCGTLWCHGENHGISWVQLSSMAILEAVWNSKQNMWQTCGKLFTVRALYGFLWLYDVQITFGAFKQLGSSSPMN